MPTPLNKYREQDLSFVISAAKTIPTNARRPVIILEWTTYPGTAVEVLAPLFEKRNLSVGRDIVLAFSPRATRG